MTGEAKISPKAVREIFEGMSPPKLGGNEPLPTM